MRSVLIYLICLHFSVVAYAECGYGHLSYWPQDEKIKQNSLFMIEGDGRAQDIVLGLNNKYPIFLESEQGRIEVIITETLISQFGICQAIFLPSKKLQADITYRLAIDNLPTNEKQYKWNFTKEHFKPIEWLVESGDDKSPPAWKSSPYLTDKSYLTYGNGPQIQAEFHIDITENAEYLIKTTLVNTFTNDSATFYIIPWDSVSLLVGHRMCEGAFKYSYGDPYVVKFEPMDASGNLTPWQGEWIRFRSPTLEEDSGW